MICGPLILPLALTFTAVLPHAQVDLRDVVTAAVTMGQLSHPEDILLDACDVVAVITQHPCQRGLLQLGQLRRSEHAGVFIPEPGRDRIRDVTGRKKLFTSHTLT